jgi:phosphate transport system permease protein
VNTDVRRATTRPAAHPAVLGRRDFVPTFAALCAAAGIAVILWGVFGWHDARAVGVITYVMFVVALTGAVIVRSGDADTLDLVEAERADPGEAGEPGDAPAEPDTAELPILTAVPDAGLPPASERPSRQRRLRAGDLSEAWFAALAAAAIAEFLRVFLKMRSLVGLSVWWSLSFLVLYFVLVCDGSDADAAVDRIVTVLVWAAGALVSATLVWMVWFAVAKGLPKLALGFFTEDLSKVGPLNPGGGAKHAIIGTLEQVGIATGVVVPIAIMTAVYLNELQGRLARPVRFIVDAMSGLPSIVAGLLVFTVVVPSQGFSGVAGSMALAVLMLPTVTRASEEILRTVPDTLREGALALGAPEWKLVQRVVLPTALAGLVTAAILGVARAIGETAPMLLTAFGADTTNKSPLHGPQDDLPLFVWKLVRSPVPTQVQRGFTGALILVMLIFVLFAIARYVANRGQRRLGRASS